MPSPDPSLVHVYRSSLLPAVLAQDALPPSVWTELREMAVSGRFESFDIAHRGRYEQLDLDADALPDELIAFAEAVTGTALSSRAQRLMRLRHGDYSLTRDDAARGAGALAPIVEVDVDLSDGGCSEAEVVFTHRGQAFFTMDQQPGSMAIVQRGDTVARYDRYLTHRVGAAEVLRLQILLSAPG